MKRIYRFFQAAAFFILCTGVQHAWGQCSTGVSPSYSAGCTSQYFTSITASGTGVTSTIGYSGSSCTGSYYNYFSSQGIIATAGATVNIPVTRSTGYAAYLAVYVDWNNNGTFELSELTGSTVYLSTGTGSTTYSFTVPTTGVITGTNLNMRIFLGEPHYAGGSVSAPCSAWWGQTNDYYCNVICPLTAVSVSPTSGSICSGAATGVTLTATGAGTGGTYTWTPSTGLSATTGASVVALPPATTTYTVTGTDVTGCAGTAPVTVTVNPLPATSITPAVSSVCAGGSVTLSAPVAAGNTYQWYNGSTVITGATNSTYEATPVATTSYSVQVTSGVGCTATSTAATVTVNPLPPAVITASGSLSICPGNTVTLSVGTGTGYTYQWYESGTPVSGATSASYGVNAAGNYYVIVTTPALCLSTSSTAGVTINPVPAAAITVSGATTFCANDSVTLTANSGTGYTYQWSDGGGVLPGATNITYTAHGSGSYSVTVTNSYGCSTTPAGGVAITVNTLPTTTVTAAGATTVCYPNAVTLNAVSIAGNTYQWYDGTTAIPGATNASYVASTTGSYGVAIINTVTGCAASTTAPGFISVTIRPRPDASVTPSTPYTRFCSYDSVVLSGISGPGLTYQWLISGIPITGATNVTYSVHNSGNYKLVVFNGTCHDTTATPFTDTVDPAPAPGISASGPVSFCAGSSVILTATTGAGYTYQWYAGSTISLSTSTAIPGATTNTLTADSSAYYHVLITSPQGCVTTSTIIRVLAVPMPVISAGGPLAFCEGINVVLSVTPVSGAVYQWKRNSMSIPSAVSANYVATSTGDYSCFANVPGICAATTAPVHVEVFPSPNPVITFDGAILRVAGYYTSYQWYINTVTIPGATSNHVAAYTNASYRVLVTDTNGCTRISGEYEIFDLAAENANLTGNISVYPNPVMDVVHIANCPKNCEVSITGLEGKQIMTSGSYELDTRSLPAGMYMITITDNKSRRLYTGKLIKQ